MGVREKHPGQSAQLQARIQRLTTAGFRTGLAQRLGAAAMKQVADEFQGERDPYGRAWQKLAPATRKASKREHAKILRRSGVMAASAAAVPSSAGFQFTMAWPAPVHQRGGFVAPHSRAHGTIQRHNEKTGRLVRAGKAAILVRAKPATFAHGITIPQRQIVPMASTGGLGPIWTRAFNLEAGRMVRAELGAR